MKTDVKLTNLIKKKKGGRPKDYSYKTHPSYFYLEEIRKILSYQYKKEIDDRNFSEILHSSENYLFTKLPSKIRTNSNPYISYETILNWEFIFRNDKNIDHNGLAQFYELTLRYIKIAKIKSKYPNKYRFRDISEQLLLNLRFAFSVGRKELISQIELSEVLSFPKSVLGKLIRSGYTRDTEFMSEWSLSRILYAIERCDYIFLDKELATAAIINYAHETNHPMIKNTPEYRLIEKLQYAFSDEYNIKNSDYLRFYSYQELSKEFNLSRYWASDVIHNKHIPREGDTLNKIRISLNEKLTGKQLEYAIKALEKYFSLNRYEKMNSERIKNWLSSRYGEEYGDEYSLSYPVTKSGLLRMVEKVLKKYSSEFKSNRVKNYKQCLIEQMGMEAIAGESICTRDISFHDTYLHHIFYWKGTADPDHLLLVTRFNHPSIAHPRRKKELTIESIKNMITLERAKRSFRDGRPPEHWSYEAKQEYYERLRLYKILGFEIFLHLNGYITQKES